MFAHLSKLSLLISFIIIFVSKSINSQKWTDIVELPNGKIRGEILMTDKGTQYYSFKGIPYAAPPIGDLRFEPPVEVENWEDVLNCTSDIKSCYQLIYSNNQPELNFTEITEDCLYLSVYIPVVPNIHDTNKRNLPVMFWIYGGAFALGTYSSFIFGPDYFMDYGVIIVTHNYRLGAFGFLATEDMVLPGNAGLKDQLFALKWVNQNIHLFGGSPDKITIFGQSAGAASASHHLNSPLSTNLFRATILESGSTLNSWSYVKNPRNIAYKVAAYLNGSINESNTSTDELITYLKGLTASEISFAAQLVMDEQSPQHDPGINGLFYGPVIEPNHPDAIVTESMYDVISTGRSNRVPIMMGFTSEEALYQLSDLDYFRTILKAWDDNVSLVVPYSMNILSDTEKLYVGKFIKLMYCAEKKFADCLEGAVRYYSDQLIIRGVIEHAILQSTYSDVYLYKFSYDGPLGMSDNVLEGVESVGHSEELYYLWKIVSVLLNNFPDNDILTHHRLLTLWTNFAKYKNPTFRDGAGILQNITWPNFHHGYLDIGENLTIQSQPRNETFSFWQFLFKTFGIPPFITF